MTLALTLTLTLTLNLTLTGAHAALLDIPRGWRRTDPAPLRVIAHDVRSFHPGQVRYAAELASSLCLYSVVEQVRLTARLRVRRKGQLP